jgi:hypothetical protein
VDVRHWVDEPTVKNTIIACVAPVITSFACCTPDQPYPPPAAAPVKAVVTVDATTPDAQFMIETASVAFALFKNNRLVNCIMDAVTINAGTGYKPDPAVTLDTTQLARLLMDDAKVAFDSRRGNALLKTTTSGKSSLSKGLLAFAVGAKQVDPSAVPNAAEVSPEPEILAYPGKTLHHPHLPR